MKKKQNELSKYRIYNVSQDVLIDNDLIFFGTSQITEKSSLGWESNPVPLTFQVSTLTTRPPRHLSVTVPPSKGLFCFSYHCSHLLLVEDPLKFDSVFLEISQ